MANKKSRVSLLLEAYEKVAATKDGQLVLNHIYQLCDYDSPIFTCDDERDVNVNSTLYNLGKRNVWLDVRKMLTRIDRNNIEVGGNELCQISTEQERTPEPEQEI